MTTPNKYLRTIVHQGELYVNRADLACAMLSDEINVEVTVPARKALASVVFALNQLE